MRYFRNVVCWNSLGERPMNRGLRGYWSTGVAGGTEAAVATLGSDWRAVSNALFMVCSPSESFIVHYTSLRIFLESRPPGTMSRKQ